MAANEVIIDGVRVPQFLYGTAWKEDDTQRLTELAIRTGFRGIDTANQRRHYDEAAVGRAIAASIASGRVARDDLFLQTKFTFRPGQDHRLPYDPSAPIAVQVRQSFASSLQHLGTDRVDSYVLHGPSLRDGLTEDDWSAWRAMEELHQGGGARLLGVSNVNLAQLKSIWQQARVRPHFVQNRCYASHRWDGQIRKFCSDHQILYQGFSLLTANRAVMTHPRVMEIARRHGKSAAQVVFRFALDIGMIPLTGTTNPENMRADLAVFDFCLDAEDVARIEGIAAH